MALSSIVMLVLKSSSWSRNGANHFTSRVPPSHTWVAITFCKAALSKQNGLSRLAWPLEGHRSRHPHFQAGQSRIRQVTVIRCIGFLANLNSGSKNLFLNFGTLSGMTKHSSNPTPPCPPRSLPPHALSAKYGKALCRFRAYCAVIGTRNFLQLN